MTPVREAVQQNVQESLAQVPQPYGTEMYPPPVGQVRPFTSFPNTPGLAPPIRAPLPPHGIRAPAPGSSPAQIKDYVRNVLTAEGGYRGPGRNMPNVGDTPAGTGPRPFTNVPNDPVMRPPEAVPSWQNPRLNPFGINEKPPGWVGGAGSPFPNVAEPIKAGHIAKPRSELGIRPAGNIEAPPGPLQQMPAPAPEGSPPNLGIIVENPGPRVNQPPGWYPEYGQQRGGLAPPAIKPRNVNPVPGPGQDIGTQRWYPSEGYYVKPPPKITYPVPRPASPVFNPPEAKPLPTEPVLPPNTVPRDPQGRPGGWIEEPPPK